jgi:protein involved in polysaccharide export with SLBB domain
MKKPGELLTEKKRTVDEGKLRTVKDRESLTVEERKMMPADDGKVLKEEEELSPIEQSLLTEETTKDSSHPLPYRVKRLNQFGYNFFKPTAQGFSPLTDIPVGSDYVVGPGDKIVLNLWGSVEGTYELEVNRSGEIFLPRVGNIKVWGVTFGEMQALLKNSLSKIYRDFGVNVTMGKLRIMKVFVVGEVTSPGDYNLSSLSTLINALSAAGGPLKTGSLRSIQVKRAGKVVETADLYDFFLSGDKSRDIRLQPGDTIFVPVIGRVAGISGNVKRPAIYELKDETNLFDLVTLAEGFLPTGYLQRIQLSRIDAHEKKVVADFNLDPKSKEKTPEELMKSIKIQDMDLVKIFPIDKTLRDHVRLSGYVLRPGDYALKPGMRVLDLLPKDNLLPEFYHEAAEITRLYPPDYHPEKLFVNLAKALSGDPEFNLELKEFDEVRIFSRWEMEEMPKVWVNGEVQNPGEYRLFDNMRVRDLIMAAGNLKITAYKKFAELSRIKQTGESVTSFPITIVLEDALKGDETENLVLRPFDELSVRKIPNWVEEMDRHVTLSGEVKFPGIYPIYRGEKLSSVIERAGGFTPQAYLQGAKFTRETVRETQQKRMDEVIGRTEQEILKKQGELAALAASKEELEATRASLDGLQKGLDKLKSAKAEGRMVIELTPLPEFEKSEYNIELAGGDQLVIPKTPNEVTVLGQVYNPTSLVYMRGKSVSYYLNRSGGATRDAEEDDMYIVRADGTVVSRQQSSLGFNWNDDTKSWYFGSFLSTQMQPGDTLVVPQKLERIAWMREIKDIASILGNIALTAGVIVAAGL